MPDSGNSGIGPRSGSTERNRTAAGTLWRSRTLDVNVAFSTDTPCQTFGAQRTFGAAYQFVPPMSVTLGMRECLAARQIRLFSDTGAWKQTALRVALFAEPTPEYPITLLQTHPDALLTATLETARHPLAEHPEWELF